MGHRADHTLCHHRQRPWNKEKVEAARQSPRCRRERVNGRQPGQCRLRKRWGQAEVLPHRLWDRWMGKLSQGEDALRGGLGPWQDEQRWHLWVLGERAGMGGVSLAPNSQALG